MSGRPWLSKNGSSVAPSRQEFRNNCRLIHEGRQRSVKVVYSVGMKSQANTASFVLFVIVLLAALFWLLHGKGHTQWGLVVALLGVLVLRGGLFFYNLAQQRKRVERPGALLDLTGEQLTERSRDEESRR